MTEARKITEFLIETTKRDDVPGRLRKLVVSHVVKGNKLGDEIRAVTVPETPDEEWATAVATKIVDHAAGEAVALAAGVQRYAVLALFEGDDKPHGRHVFTVQGPSEEDNEIGTEGPDENGLVGQSMRHTEFFAREHGRSSVYRERMLIEENQQLRRECSDLRAEAVKRFKLMEDLSSQRHERELAMLREQSNQKRIDRAADSLELMVPFAINHIAGRKLLKELAPEALLIKQLAEKMTPDQFAQVTGVLGPELGATLWHLMQMVAKPAETAPPAAADKPHTNGATAP